MVKVNPQVTIEFNELRSICDRADRAERALERIYRTVMTHPEEDEHGNVGKRSLWLEKVYNDTWAALGEAGYAVYKPKPLISIPNFVRERDDE